LANKGKEQQPREMTKRQMSHHQKQERRQKIILFGGISVILVVVLLVTSGWYFGNYAPLHASIVEVYDTKLTELDFIETMEYYGKLYVMYDQSIDLSAQADSILSYMIQNELLRRAAEQLGVTVSEQEIKDYVGSNTTKLSKAQKSLAIATILSRKLQNDYFKKQVGDSGNQVLMNTMMVESEDVVSRVRDRLLSGDNFSILASQYAVNPVSISNNGTFTWHAALILSNDLGNSIPVDWAFSSDTNKGDISPALADNVTTKQLGYWLINVKSRSNSGNISSDNMTGQALFVSSEAQAKYVKTLLESTDNISSIVDQYNQYTPTKATHGDLGMVFFSDNISTAFNDYAFSANTTLGVWSDPVKDTNFTTIGNYWVVQIVDKSNDRPYTSSDKNALVVDAYYSWSNGLYEAALIDIVYKLTDAQTQYAIDQANKYLSKYESNTGQ
jgi:hypothetical protein